jgi:hypothetical protein
MPTYSPNSCLVIQPTPPGDPLPVGPSWILLAIITTSILIMARSLWKVSRPTHGASVPSPPGDGVPGRVRTRFRYPRRLW